jgi:hypothetical protein
MHWRSMGNAPHDGTPFLGFDAYGEYQVARMDEGMFRSWETGKRVDLDAWQPLPDPYVKEIPMTAVIDLSPAEIQSGLNRVKQAENFGIM